jgi:hypothetical protein
MQLRLEQLGAILGATSTALCKKAAISSPLGLGASFVRLSTAFPMGGTLGAARGEVLAMSFMLDSFD